MVGLRTWVHPLHSVGKAVGSIIVIDTQRPGNNARVCWRCGSVGVDVVSSPGWVHYNGMRSSKGRPAGNEVDELSETEHVGDFKGQYGGSMQVSFSFVRGARFRYRKSRGKPSSVRWRGHQHLWDLTATPCATTADLRMRTPSSEWDSAKRPAASAFAGWPGIACHPLCRPS